MATLARVDAFVASLDTGGLQYATVRRSATEVDFFFSRPTAGEPVARREVPLHVRIDASTGAFTCLVGANKLVWAPDRLAHVAKTLLAAELARPEAE